ncbi:non-ribosomal peptide [Micractinium conductrix]|uniref:Non-ribosomal peptide n=1 Tax=Micractinium conductrix TaxID=554055 RepID=A0A2P6V0T8_9CHLO|nr:non-ribosomal peptide [Micractinium conductrix]|eukprot:PSC67708.1 non-ribosomal peptide [Micractinium conductrix]
MLEVCNVSGRAFLGDAAMGRRLCLVGCAIPAPLHDVRCSGMVSLKQHVRGSGWLAHPAVVDAALQLGPATGDVFKEDNAEVTRVVAGMAVCLAINQISARGRLATSSRLALRAGDVPGVDMYGRTVQGLVWNMPRLVARKPDASLAARGVSTAAAKHLDGAVIITGGLGALGALASAWLCGTSSQSDLWLLGRSGRASGETMAQPVHSVRQVTCAKADASAAEEAAHVLTSAGSGSQLLHGILHAGAVLDSKVMTNVNATTIRTEFAGKVYGAQHLLSGCMTSPLAVLHLFSSLAAFSGTAGQASYASANGMLDAWAHAAQSQGAVGLSVQWGNWGGGGMATRSKGFADRMERMGLGIVRPSEGLRVMARLLHEVASSQCVWSSQQALFMCNIFHWGSILRDMPSLPFIFEEFAQQLPNAFKRNNSAPLASPSSLSSDWSMCSDNHGFGMTEVAGLSCTYPGTAAIGGVSGFWNAAIVGADLPTVVPHNRWPIERHYSPDVAVNKMYVRFAAFLPGVDTFDAALFRLSHGEASVMDPQCRVLLEHTHLSLTDASSRSRQPVPLDTGVYVGVMQLEFLQYCTNAGLAVGPNLITGNGMDFLVGRISYTFGLKGPCISTNTACSSSLVATHLAHTGLLEHEAAAAAACGVLMVLLPESMSGICLLQALSPAGRCKTFEASGDGYGRGEG